MAAAADAAKSPGHAESLRPQPRAKPKRKEMVTLTQTRGEENGSLKPARGGHVDVDVVKPRKRRWLGRHTEEEEARRYVCNSCKTERRQWYSVVWHARTDHKQATTVNQKMKDGTVAVTHLLQRSLQCPYCPMKCALKQCRTMHLQVKHARPRRPARHNSPKVECKESAVHLLECPSLRELRKKHGLEALNGGKLFFSAQLVSFLKELFKLVSPSFPTPDEPKLIPARDVKR
ncbi:hypothetical protein TRVL_09644 [Trypanosoma vivax]|nr:hypothetical protein TRVL_09644 [Trypanosoma vivax]